MLRKLLMILLVLIMLVGCQVNDGADYEGRYNLIRKDECTYLVIIWEYPMEGFDQSTFDVSLENVNDYLDENANENGSGLILNRILGNMGYNRSFLHYSPIDINADGIEKITKKKMNLYMTMGHEDGNTYKIRLKLDLFIQE